MSLGSVYDEAAMVVLVEGYQAGFPASGLQSGPLKVTEDSVDA